MSYGYEGPICTDLRAALLGASRRSGRVRGDLRLGGRDVTPDDLADATRRAIADLDAGMIDRPTDWINLKREA